MFVTESGIVIEVSPVQSKKAAFPMLVTELGMVTDVIFDAPINASSGIVVVPSANMTEPV